MSRDKQIEEIRNDLCEVDIEFSKFCRGRHCPECEYYFAKTDCKNQLFAEKLTDKGYRKVDSVTFIGGIVEQMRAEVAREIIAIIEQRRSMNAESRKGVSNELWKTIFTSRDYAYRDIKEIIEHKYTEGE